MVRLFLICLLLAGCTGAGVARYEWTRTNPDGSTDQIVLENGKNIGEISAGLETDGVKVYLIEKGVDASGPMAIQAETNRGLVEILGDVMTAPVPVAP